MSAIKKLGVQYKNAKRTRTPKILISRDEAKALLEEFNELEQRIVHLSQANAEQRIEISNLKTEISTDNNEQKSINISGGKFTEE